MIASRNIEIDAPDGVADAYLAHPEARPGPGVLFIMDAFGLRPRIREMADRIAGHGYTVLAPNVFYRAGRDPVGQMPDLTGDSARGEFFGRVRPLMEQLTQDAAEADGAAYLDELARVSDGPFAATGYCMGGRFALRIAAAHPRRVVAVGAFHPGGLVTDAPDSPHRVVSSVRAELLFGFADNDAGMTAENIAELEGALRRAGVRYDSAVYPGAIHGFTMSDTPAYSEAAAERHFSELFALLERTIAVTS